MPDPVTGVTAAVGIGGAVIGSKSASKASRAQVEAAEAGTAEQRAAREELRRLLQPYTSAGPVALQGMLDLLGLNAGGGTAGGGAPDWQSYLTSNPDVAAEYQRVAGTGQFNSPEQFAQWHFQNYGQREGRQSPVTVGGAAPGDLASRQNAAIEAQAQNPLFLALAKQGEEGILQNASATGGLRGGNVQGALAQFRPALLDRFISQYYDRLAGITSLGQQSAAGVGSAGIQTGTNIANLLSEAGAARAGNAVAQGDVWSRLLGGVGGIATGVLNKPPAPAGGF